MTKMRKIFKFSSIVVTLIFLCHQIVWADVLRPLAEGESKRNQNTRFQEYLKEKDLSQYKTLCFLFTDEMKDILLDDPSLRPVFLVVLPRQNVGPIEIVEPDGLRKIGGTDFLDAHSAFLAGSPAIAERMILEKKYRIIVGVTDRLSYNTLQKIGGRLSFSVQSARQAYFPLTDGTWLGVMGSGQYLYDKERPVIYNVMHGEHRYIGLVDKRNPLFLIGINHSRLLQKSRGRFVPVLGYRQIYSLPDGAGGFVDASKLNGPPCEPVLIFHRILHPHRMGKLPQLLNNDPELAHLRVRVSRTLCNLGYLPKGKVLSLNEYMEMFSQEMGLQEAIKQNLGIFKSTMKEQDFSIAAEEAGADECMGAHDFKEYLKGQSAHAGLSETTDLSEEIFVLSKYAICLRGLMAKLDMFEAMSESTPLDKALIQRSIETFFSTYFNNLDNKWLKVWAEQTPTSPILQRLLKHIELIKMYKSFGKTSDEERKVKIANMIIGWAKEVEAAKTKAKKQEPKGPMNPERVPFLSQI